MMKIGFGKLDITPPIGILMGGHTEDKRSTGIHDPIFVRSMFIRDKCISIVFISVDVLFITNITAANVRKAISKRIKINKNNIFIFATHTHSGPLTSSLFGRSAEGVYTRKLEKKIIDSVLIAFKNLQKAKISVAKSTIKGITYNSRFLMKDGSVNTHPMKGDPNILKPEGPIDNEIIALFARDYENNLLGCLFNYANHPQILKREDAYISADFPGAVERYIRTIFTNSPIILFGNGACGNLCPVDAQNRKKVEVGYKYLKYMGDTLGKKIIEIERNSIYRKELNIDVKSMRFKIPIRDITLEKIEEAKNFINIKRNKDLKPLKLSNYGIEKNENVCVLLEDYLKTDQWKLQEYTDILRLFEEKRRRSEELVEISIVSFNNTVILMLPFELFVEYGIEIKQNSKWENTIIIELANGYSGYVPTEEAFKRKGGYETLTLGSSKLIPEAGKIIIKNVSELMGINHENKNY